MHRGGGGDKSETKAYSLLVTMSRIGWDGMGGEFDCIQNLPKRAEWGYSCYLLLCPRVKDPIPPCIDSLHASLSTGKLSLTFPPLAISFP